MVDIAAFMAQGHQTLMAQAITYNAAPGSEGGEAGPEGGAPMPFVRPTTPLKDRFNYLSSDGGAKVLASSAGMKGGSNILTEDRDRYMMTDRAAKKKSISLKLAGTEPIALDTIVVGTYEHYSASVRR